MIALDLIGLAWGFFLLGCGLLLIVVCGAALTERARKHLEESDRDEGWPR
jgi:hypothetical protein